MTNAGGAATGGGIEFQARATAWWLAQMAAESELDASIEISGRVVSVQCETGQPTDDILVEVVDETMTNGFLFCQAKRTLSVSTAADSEFASVGDQFARQFLANAAHPAASNPWERPLRTARDALVLITTNESPRGLTVHLPAALHRVRGLASTQGYLEGCKNNDERSVVSSLVTVLQVSATAERGSEFTEGELKELLALVRVLILSLDDDGAHAKTVVADLSESAIDVQEARQRWGALVKLGNEMITDQDRNDRPRLLRRISFAAIPRHRREALTRLRTLSDETVTRLSRLTTLPRRGLAPLHVHRGVIDAIADEAAKGHVAVIGSPGAGKSGAVTAWATRERATSDIVCLAVDSTEVATWSELPDLLSNWPGPRPGYLVVDALDAARGDERERAVRSALERIAAGNSRWRIVASVRTFDLINGSLLQAVFRGVAHPQLKNDAPELQRVHHVSVEKLTDAELDVVKQQHADLADVLANAPSELDSLLRSPFNLWLLADLLTSGVAAPDLRGIATAIELLDRWWDHRVGVPARARIGREGYLARVSTAMVGARNLATTIDSADGAEEHLHDLQSAHVLEQPRPRLVSFTHHAIFDYAVERLLLQVDSSKLTTLLNQDRELAVFARPSFTLHFTRLWRTKRDEFWEKLNALFVETGISAIARIAPANVVVDNAKALDDLRPLVEAIADEKRSQTAFKVLKVVIDLVGDGSARVGPLGGPWLALANELVTR